MAVGRSAPASNPSGTIAPSKKRPSSAWPAGFGAFAITVNPPPTTAPCTTASFSSSPRFGRCKRVENRQDKHARGDGVERLDLHTHGEIGGERLIGAGWVTLQGPRNRRDRGRVVAHRGADLRKLTDVDRVVMIGLSRHPLHELRQRRKP